MPLPYRCFSSTPPPIRSRLGSLHVRSARTWMAPCGRDLPPFDPVDVRLDCLGVKGVSAHAAASRALGLARNGVGRRVREEAKFSLGSDGVHGRCFSKHQHEPWQNVPYTPLRCGRSEPEADAVERLRIRPNGQVE